MQYYHDTQIRPKNFFLDDNNAIVNAKLGWEITPNMAQFALFYIDNNRKLCENAQGEALLLNQF